MVWPKTKGRFRFSISNRTPFQAQFGSVAGCDSYCTRKHSLAPFWRSPSSAVARHAARRSRIGVQGFALLAGRDARPTFFFGKREFSGFQPFEIMRKLDHDFPVSLPRTHPSLDK